MLVGMLQSDLFIYFQTERKSYKALHFAAMHGSSPNHCIIIYRPKIFHLFLESWLALHARSPKMHLDLCFKSRVKSHSLAEVF